MLSHTVVISYKMLKGFFQLSGPRNQRQTKILQQHAVLVTNQSNHTNCS